MQRSSLAIRGSPARFQNQNFAQGVYGNQGSDVIRDTGQRQVHLRL